jgi:hypothetical protein
MRVIAEVFIPVLVIGCLVAAVAVAWKREGAVASCGGAYANRTPTPEELTTVLRNHQAWVESYGAADNVRKANLCQANLRGANLQEAELFGANLQEAVYEPNSGKLPKFWTLTHRDNHLDKLVFRRSPAALMALRKAFKEGGMLTQERQLTYAIEHTKRLEAWDPSWYDPWEEDTRPWLEKLAGKSESLFNYVLFKLPYWLAIKHANRRSGIWMIVPEDRIAPGRGKEKIILLRPLMAKTWREHLVGEARMLRTGLYFSLLSAFHLGWREYNVGTWIARLQFREYTLRATGWVRMVSGIQSLLSVYLLALWVLTYFGRLFE